jgi:hypothetical protein
MTDLPQRGQFGTVVARRGGKNTMLVPVVFVATDGWPTRPAAPRVASARIAAGGLEG